MKHDKQKLMMYCNYCFQTGSGALLILEDRLSKRFSETGRIVDAVFGVDNSAGRFCGVCSGSGEVLEISKVVSFHLELIQLYC